MTAAEILRSAEPPPDDGLIEKAIADLDMRIWEWADALKNAHSQLRSAFAARPATTSPAPMPAVPGQRPSASLYDIAPSSSLSAAAAAAHIPSPPPMPAEWTAPPSAPTAADWAAAAQPIVKEPSWSPSHGGHGASANAPAGSSHGVQLAEGSSGPGVMSWPTAPASNWPEADSSSASSGGSLAWPTWTPTDTSASAPSTTQAKQGKSGLGGTPMRPGKATKGAKPAVEGPSPEERAQKAAAEEALLSELEDAIARRVRLLRRLDPDTPIEKLIDKAKQGQAEAPAASAAKEDKSSSWWRRK